LALGAKLQQGNEDAEVKSCPAPPWRLDKHRSHESESPSNELGAVLLSGFFPLGGAARCERV